MLIRIYRWNKSTVGVKEAQMFLNVLRVMVLVWREMLPAALRASRRPAAWPLWRSPPADWDPKSPSPDTDLRTAQTHWGRFDWSDPSELEHQNSGVDGLYFIFNKPRSSWNMDQYVHMLYDCNTSQSLLWTYQGHSCPPELPGPCRPSSPGGSWWWGAGAPCSGSSPADAVWGSVSWRPRRPRPPTWAWRWSNAGSGSRSDPGSASGSHLLLLLSLESRGRERYDVMSTRLKHSHRPEKLARLTFPFSKSTIRIALKTF